MLARKNAASLSTDWAWMRPDGDWGSDFGRSFCTAAGLPCRSQHSARLRIGMHGQVPQINESVATSCRSGLIRIGVLTADPGCGFRLVDDD